jgi:hypothetical protein
MFTGVIALSWALEGVFEQLQIDLACLQGRTYKTDLRYFVYD